MVLSNRWTTGDTLTAAKLNATISKWGVDADKSTPSLIGEAYLATDTYILYVSTNGSTWDYSINVNLGDKNKANGIPGLDSSGVIIGSVIKKVASANIRNSHDAMASTASATYVKLKTITLTNGVSGTLRYYFEMGNWTDGSTVYARIYRNGAALGTEQTAISTGSYASKSEDITQDWSTGDTCELWGHTNGAATIQVQNFRLLYDDIDTNTIAATNS